MENCSSSFNAMPSIVRNRKDFCSNQADGNYLYCIEINQVSHPGAGYTTTSLSACAQPFNHPLCSTAFRKKVWYCNYFHCCSLFFLTRDASTKMTRSVKKQETSFDKQDVGFSSDSHSYLFSLWLCKHPQLPTDSFTYCTHNTCSFCCIYCWASVGAVGMSLRVLMLVMG